MKIEIKQAVELVYRGKANMIEASKAADIKVETLKQLLVERCQLRGDVEPIQLEMLL